MIDGSEKRIRQLAFKLQNWHVCEKHSNLWAIQAYFNCLIQSRSQRPRHPGQADGQLRPRLNSVSSKNISSYLERWKPKATIFNGSRVGGDWAG